MHETILEKDIFSIIGDEDVVIGFKALGFRVYTAKVASEDISGMLKDMVNSGTTVCLIQEEFYKDFQKEIEGYKASPIPVFIPFSKSGKVDTLDAITKDIRLRATGTT